MVAPTPAHPTPESDELACAGRFDDGIPAVTPAEWEARETARVERIAAMWRAAGNLVTGGRPMVSVRCRALGKVFLTVESCAREIGVSLSTVHCAMTTGKPVKGLVLERVRHARHKTIGNDKSRPGRSLVKNRRIDG